MIHKIIFWIMVILTVFWIYEFIMNIVFWIGEEEDRIFPWKGISIIIFHMLITIFSLFTYKVDSVTIGKTKGEKF